MPDNPTKTNDNKGMEAMDFGDIPKRDEQSDAEAPRQEHQEAVKMTLDDIASVDVHVKDQSVVDTAATFVRHKMDDVRDVITSTTNKVVDTTKGAAGRAVNTASAIKVAAQQVASVATGGTLDTEAIKEKVSNEARVRRTKGTDPTFSEANIQRLDSIPLQQFTPTILSEAEVVALVPRVKMRRSAAAILWLKASRRVARIRQTDTGTVYDINFLRKAKGMTYTDCVPLTSEVQVYSSYAERLDYASWEVKMNVDPAVLQRVFTILKPMLSNDDVSAIADSKAYHGSITPIISPESTYVIDDQTFRSRFVSVVGRSASEDIPEQSQWSRHTIIGNKRIAPEDAIATVANLGMMTLTDLITLLMMTSNLVRKNMGVCSDSYKAFDRVLVGLYLNGTPTGITSLMEAAKVVVVGDAQGQVVSNLGVDFCASLLSQHGIVIGLLSFLGRHRFLNKVFYFYRRLVC